MLIIVFYCKTRLFSATKNQCCAIAITIMNQSCCTFICQKLIDQKVRWYPPGLSFRERFVLGFRDSGFWFLVSGFWFLVSGFWFMVYGLWFMVEACTLKGFWFLVAGSGLRDYGSGFKIAPWVDDFRLRAVSGLRVAHLGSGLNVGGCTVTQ